MVDGDNKTVYLEKFKKKLLENNLFLIPNSSFLISNFPQPLYYLLSFIYY